ncbi:MAG: low affinity iron permease family protein [Candidatus Sericytochromatia bacterium]|nr:low affinity iron permease family protein [Candidatus Tanganyikabacteria bacterium]
MNTATTVLTFLIVFLIQSTQNRESAAIQLKLDELLEAVEGARTRLVDIEEDSDQELAELKDEFRQVHGREGKSRAGHG